MRQLSILHELHLSENFYSASVLTVGGSTKLIKKGKHIEGDLSGILKKHTSLSLNEIAPYIGVQDHTTVLYNVSTAKDLMLTEDWYKNKIDEIESEIKKYNTFVQN
jgi:hypothetical protein